MALISAIAVTCERVLIERDGVTSLVRMVEWFGIHPNAPMLEGGKRPPVVMSLFITVRFTGDDDDYHSVSFEIERPDGDLKKQDVMPARILAPSNIPGGDKVMNVSAQIGVEVLQFGKHIFHILVDGVRVAMTPVFILESPPESLPNSNSPVN